MEKIKEYLLLAFLIENVLAQTPYANLVSALFYIFLFGGIYVLCFDILPNIRDYYRHKCFFQIALLLILYQFTLGLGTISERSILYLLSRISVFSIIVYCTTNYPEYYVKKVPVIVALLMVVIIIDGLNTGRVVQQRLLLGYTNANETSLISAYAFAILLYLPKRMNYFIVCAMAICIYGVLGGGSRNGFLVFVIFTIMRYGKSTKTVLLLSSIVILVFAIFPFLGIPTLPGIERVIDTINGTVTSNRETERLATQMMIAERPWTGWGFEAPNVGVAALISKMGSHNGYLDTIKWMGYPFAIVFFILLLYKMVDYKKFWVFGDIYSKYHYAVVVATFCAAVYEAFFVGIHHICTNLFFMSLACLLVYEPETQEIENLEE